MKSKCRTALVVLSAAVALTALSAGPALASGPPFVETKAATPIGETTATLHGLVNPNGAETKYWFEYGTTTSYGTKTAEASAGAGTTNIEESKAITGLAANTTYHFRVVAKNANGTANGADAVFTTALKPGLPEFVPKVGSKGETFPLAMENSFFNSTVQFGEEEWGVAVTCTQVKLKGSITNAKTASFTDTFEHCQANREDKCSTTEWSENGIITLSGTGSLVYLSKSTKQVGVVLPLGKVTVYCGGGVAEEKLKGSIISPITPVNTETTKPEMKYHQKKTGEDEFTEYENEKGEKVAAKFEWNVDGGFKPGSLEILGTIGLTTPRGLTIKA